MMFVKKKNHFFFKDKIIFIVVTTTDSLVDYGHVTIYVHVNLAKWVSIWHLIVLENGKNVLVQMYNMIILLDTILVNGNVPVIVKTSLYEANAA